VFQSPLGEGAKVGRGERVLRGREGLKKLKIPQTTQYPKEIPKTKDTTMVKSNKNDNSTGVMYSLFYDLRKNPYIVTLGQFSVR
jgi:hypothetical protein